MSSSIWSRVREWFPNRLQFLFLPRVLSKGERYLISGLCAVILFSLLAMPIIAWYHATMPVASNGGSWIEGMIGTPQYINPLLLQGNDADSDISSLVYSGLLRYDGKGNLVPDLAESYSVSDDGLHYTVKLKQNARWHDGQSVTADDVLFTILTAQNAEYKSPQRINWQGGVDVGKIDDQTVVFTLKNRYAQFLGNLTIGILPKHIWGNIRPSNFALIEYNTRPIGSGPYRISKIQRDTLGTIRALELSAFDKYLPRRPYINTITFKFYESEQALITGYNSGEVDGLSYVSAMKLSSLRLPGQITTHAIMIPRYVAVFFNQNKSKQLSDKNVRTALEYATDKQAIVHSVLNDKAQVVESPLLPDILSIPKNTVSYQLDLKKARQMLDTGGWKISGDSKIRTKVIKAAFRNEEDQTLSLRIEITTSGVPEILAVAEALKSQWEQLGIDVVIRSLSVSEIQQTIQDRDYEALLFGEVLGTDPDPFSFWHSSQIRDPGRNLALYNNKDADKLLEDARQTLDPAQRAQKYAKLQDIILSDVPAVFLYSPEYLYIQPSKIKQNTDVLAGVPSDRFDTVIDWYISTHRSLKK